MRFGIETTKLTKQDFVQSFYEYGFNTSEHDKNHAVALLKFFFTEDEIKNCTLMARNGNKAFDKVAIDNLIRVWQIRFEIMSNLNIAFNIQRMDKQNCRRAISKRFRQKDAKSN